MLKVYANALSNQVLTTDEQSLCKRTMADLIIHAANRHAAQHRKHFYLGALSISDLTVNFATGVHHV